MQPVLTVSERRQHGVSSAAWPEFAREGEPTSHSAEGAFVRLDRGPGRSIERQDHEGAATVHDVTHFHVSDQNVPKYFAFQLQRTQKCKDRMTR